MIAPDLPENEIGRLAAVKSYNLLDTIPEEDFDNITTLVASICDTPISLITLIDETRNFLKSHHGIPFNESPREISFCGHAINDPYNLFIIEDASQDERFHDNPLVSEFKALFYAGIPLVNSEGFALGTLCVFDTKPRTLDEKQQKALTALAYQVMKLYEERKKNMVLDKLQIDLRNKNEELRQFAGTVAHDMKMPLANIIVTTDILEKKLGKALDGPTDYYLKYLKKSSFTLNGYITGLLSHYESENITHEYDESFYIYDLLEDIIDLLNVTYDCEINTPEENIEIATNKSALEQILLNLIGNSLKYNDKDQIVININCIDSGDYYNFQVSDNGIGIPEDKIETIFQLFGTTGATDRHGDHGHGIGLSTVKRIVEKLEGTITVTSEIGKGSIFEFTIKKQEEF